jgi:hypothetical protein
MSWVGNAIRLECDGEVPHEEASCRLGSSPAPIAQAVHLLHGVTLVASDIESARLFIANVAEAVIRTTTEQVMQ